MNSIIYPKNYLPNRHLNASVFKYCWLLLLWLGSSGVAHAQTVCTYSDITPYPDFTGNGFKPYLFYHADGTHSTTFYRGETIYVYAPDKTGNCTSPSFVAYITPVMPSGATALCTPISSSGYYSSSIVTTGLYQTVSKTCQKVGPLQYVYAQHQNFSVDTPGTYPVTFQNGNGTTVNLNIVSRVCVKTDCGNFGGVYEQTGMRNGKVDLFDQDGNELYFENGTWQISNSSGVAYQVTSASAYPPTTGWQPVSACAGIVVSITEGDCPPSAIRVTITGFCQYSGVYEQQGFLNGRPSLTGPNNASLSFAPYVGWILQIPGDVSEANTRQVIFAINSEAYVPPTTGWIRTPGTGNLYTCGNTPPGLTIETLPTTISSPVVMCVQTTCGNSNGKYTQTGTWNERPDLKDDDQNRMYYWGTGDLNHPEGWYIANADNKFVFYNSSTATDVPTIGWIPFTGDGVSCNATLIVSSGECPACTSSTGISYANSPFCSTATEGTVTLTGTSGGTYSSTSGLSLDAQTGKINPSASTAGTYTVTYAVNNNGCLETATASVTITTLPTASISYAGSPFCGSVTDATGIPTLTGTTGGGYQITDQTDDIGITAEGTIHSQVPGTYHIAYTIDEAGGCPVVVATTTVVIAPIVTPTASIVVNPTGTVLPGTSLTFTATISNDGTQPHYQWKKNGTNIFHSWSSTYTSANLENGDKITFEVTNNDLCGVAKTSNEIVLSIVDPCAKTPTDVLLGGLCGGYSGIYTPSGKENGAPKWEKDGRLLIHWTGSLWELYDMDGIPLATNTTGSVSNLPCTGWINDPDFVDCGTPTLSGGCGQLRNVVTPSVSISANPSGTITSGTSVTFTATPTNGGSTPSYQWKKNGNDVGSNSATYTDAGLANGDKITCVLTGNVACASSATANSNEITMSVNACIPPTPFASTFYKKVTEVPDEENGGIIYANGLFVAVNDFYNSSDGTEVGLIYTSPDGGVWTQRSLGGVITDKGFNRVAFGNGLFVAVGFSGLLQTSTDGITWTNQVANTTRNLYGITYGNGKWIAVGSSNTILTSTDGSTWINQTSNVPGTVDDFKQVAYGNGVFVVVGRNSKIVTSTDGTTWAERVGSTAGRGYFGLTFANGLFVAVGTSGLISTSTDGITWTDRTSGTTDFLSDVAYLNSQFVAVNEYNDGKILTSTTGICWSVASTGLTGKGFQGIAYGNNVYAGITSSTAIYSTLAPCTPSVSIGANPGITITSGTSVTFTATPTNGGTTPSYQWKKNGNDVGTNSATYTDVTLANGDKITCVMTSNAACASPTSATSNEITMTVNSCTFTPQNITVNSVNCIAKGNYIPNGQKNGTYAWVSTPINTKEIYWSNTNNRWEITYYGQVVAINTIGSKTNLPCNNWTGYNDDEGCGVITLTGGCGSLTAQSVTPLVSIAANPSGTITAGTSVTFTATPTYGGTTPSYVWYKNNVIIDGETSATYTTTTLANGDKITCVMTSSNPCASPTSATSNEITISLAPLKICVSEACGVLNGTYIETGTTNGKPKLVLDLGEGDALILEFSNGTPATGTLQWNINRSTNNIVNLPYIYSNPSTANTPPLTGWVSNNIFCTVPTFTAGECPVVCIPPTISINPSASSVCIGTTVNLSATSELSSYSWANSGGTFSSSTNLATFSSNTAGGYSFTVTASNGTCTNSASATVSVNALPTVSATTSTPSVCLGNAVNLSASGGSTFSWSGPSNFNSSQQNPSFSSTSTNQSGIYSLTVTASSSCTNSATVSVQVSSAPTASISPSSSVAICVGTSFSLSASSGSNFAWLGPNGFSSSNASASLNTTSTSYSGIYSVTVSSNNCTASASLSVRINALPALSIAPSTAQTICTGGSLSLTASGGSAFSWKGPNGFETATPIAPIITSNPAFSGIYSVTASNSLSCSASTTLSVVVAQTPISLSPVSQFVCPGAAFAITSNTSASSFAWRGPNNFSSAQKAISLTFSSTQQLGIYSLSITTGSCTASTTAEVKQGLASQFSSNSPVCTGSTLKLYAQGGAATYSWRGMSNGFSSTQQNPELASVKLTDSGLYTVFAKGAGNEGGCTSMGIVQVTVVEAPEAKISVNDNAPICAGAKVSLNSTGKGNPTYYAWSGPSGFSATTQKATISNFNTNKQGVYQLKVGNTYCSNTATASVVINCAARLAAEDGTTDIDLKVWENPTKGRLQVEVRLPQAEPIELHWTDQHGRKLESWILSEAKQVYELELDVTKHKSGMYLLQALSPSRQKTVKVWRVD